MLHSIIDYACPPTRPLQQTVNVKLMGKKEGGGVMFKVRLL